VTSEVTVETDPVQDIDVDGEITTQTPGHFTVAIEALKVMVPLDFQEPLG
jgi:diacylglycerol kinase (ATP)